MRISSAAHEALPWRIGEIAPDFELEDVWALPVHGGVGEFGSLLTMMAALDPTSTPSAASRALFSLRVLLGRLFRWDDTARALPIPGRTETTLADRLPRDLRDTAQQVALGSASLENLGVHFVPLYATPRESAAEISNQTVHAVLHLGWVEQEKGLFRGQMAIYVKPRGALGATYMALIRPFRYWVVYPALMSQIESAWEARVA